VENVTRTSMFLDRDLVREAQELLGTPTVVETVHEALRRAVQRERWSRAWDVLARMDWMTNEEIEALDDPKPEGYDPFEGVTEQELAEARARYQERERRRQAGT